MSAAAKEGARCGAVTGKEKKVRSAIAYHEAGHAVIARIQGIETATIDMTLLIRLSAKND